MWEMWKEKKVTNSIFYGQMENIRWKTKFSSHELEGKLRSINFTCFNGKKMKALEGMPIQIDIWSLAQFH